MKNLMKILLMALVLPIVACTGLNSPPPTIGMSEAAVIAKSGSPSARYEDGKERVIEYSSPWGQVTYMGRIGADGRLKSWAQVLSNESFAQVVIGKTTKRQVLLAFGMPAETTYLRLSELEVWSYRYKEAYTQNLMMHVHFDQAGIVQRMQGGFDPMFDTNPDRGGGK